MVRIATVRDAEQLSVLNDEFNGKDETTIDNIRNSIINNKQEVVIVADENGMLVGFVCVQLKKSFCYNEYMPEITEVYVAPTYRKKGIASERLLLQRIIVPKIILFINMNFLQERKISLPNLYMVN